jgi:hypothetical protein
MNPTCETCGARLTESWVGLFWPCGHTPPKPSETEPKEKQKIMARRRVTEDDSDNMSPTAPADDQVSVANDASASPAAPQDAPTRRRSVAEPPKDDQPGEKPAQRRLHAVSTPPEDEGGRAAPFATEGSEPGTEVTVTWGKELFSPRQFHTFEVGPFVAVVTTRPGESIAQASERAMAELKVFAEAERDRKRASYERLLESKR